MRPLAFGRDDSPLRQSLVIACRLLMLLGIILVAPGNPRRVLAAGPSLVALRAAGAREVQDVLVRPPQHGVADGQPLQMVVALHGMGGNGADFSSALFEQADAHGWLLVAPTIRYGDWTDPNQIAREDPALIAWLSGEVQQFVDDADQPLQPRVLLFGHSRGAQLALRFAEIHPEQVAGVAALSAGTYTLPSASLTFPFGLADVAREDGGTPFDARSFKDVPIWIGVGGRDTNPDDVPDQWDAYIGDDRLERAQRFVDMLRNHGDTVALTVFPGASHGLTDEMRAAACAALAEASS